MDALSLLLLCVAKWLDSAVFLWVRCERKCPDADVELILRNHLILVHSSFNDEIRLIRTHSKLQMKTQPFHHPANEYETIQEIKPSAMPFNKRIPDTVEPESQHPNGNRLRCHYEVLLLLQQFICEIISQLSILHGVLMFPSNTANENWLKTKQFVWMPQSLSELSSDWDLKIERFSLRVHESAFYVWNNFQANVLIDVQAVNWSWSARTLWLNEYIYRPLGRFNAIAFTFVAFMIFRLSRICFADQQN